MKEKKNTGERLEDILMSCRNHLRGRAAMTDKRDLLLTLVFIKFVGDRFIAQQEVIKEQYKDDEGFLNIALKNKSFYNQAGVFYLEDECFWYKLIEVEPKNMAVAFDNAIAKLEQNEEKLKNALPQQIFTKTKLEASSLKAVCDDINKIDQKRFNEKDLIGRVYEYLLQAFCMAADKEEGEFYTPHSIVELICSLIEPFDGTIYDPCCGSGGMFVQSAKFIEAHGGNTKNISVYGQESVSDTYRLAKMNLAIRGISYHLGDSNASTFSNDWHKDKKMDYIITNPPFNLKKWRKKDELLDDSRWRGYAIPPESNANYAWILHILSKLNVKNGVAGFLLANGALDDSDTLAIRQKLIEDDKVEAIFILPRDMFYRTDISVTVWILNNNKKGGSWHGKNLRNRSGEILFADFRTWNDNIYEKKYVKMGEEQIKQICDIYFNWQTLESARDKYAEPELFYAAKLEEIKENNYSLVPSKYIEFVDRDSNLDFKTILNDAGLKSKDLLARQMENQKQLIKAFETLGYKVEE